MPRPKNERPSCNCIHAAHRHDPKTGGCLAINPTFGPCPCDATPAEQLTVLWEIHDELSARRENR